MIEIIPTDDQGHPLPICRRSVSPSKCKNHVAKWKDTICQSCIAKDKKKKKRIIKRQRAIGIKQHRAKKKAVNWKSKPEEDYKFVPSKVFYAKYELINRHKVVYIKLLPNEKWRRSTHAKLNSLQKEMGCIWNPDSFLLK